MSAENKSLEERVREIDLEVVRNTSGEHIYDFFSERIKYLLNLPKNAAAFLKGEGVGGHEPEEICTKIYEIRNLQILLFLEENEDKVKELYSVVTKNKNNENKNNTKIISYDKFYKEFSSTAIPQWGDYTHNDTITRPYESFLNSVRTLWILFNGHPINYATKFKDNTGQNYI